MRAATGWQSVSSLVAHYRNARPRDRKPRDEEAFVPEPFALLESSVGRVCRIAVICIATVGFMALATSAATQLILLAGGPRNNASSSHTGASLDIVISYHNEPVGLLARDISSILRLHNIAPLDTRLFLYAKAPSTPLREIGQTLQGYNISVSNIILHELPNKGRDGETFLHHVLDCGEDLASHTMFAQADMHGPWYVQRRIEQYFVPQTGFLSLWHMETLCTNCDDCRDRSTWSPDVAVLKQIFASANKLANCSDFVPTYRGQFIASAERIRSNSHKFYESLRSKLEDSRDEDPAFGYDLERFWGVIMQCPGGRRIADRCPSMASGMLGIVGQLEDCECLDTE